MAFKGIRYLLIVQKTQAHASVLFIGRARLMGFTKTRIGVERLGSGLVKRARRGPAYVLIRCRGSPPASRPRSPRQTVHEHRRRRRRGGALPPAPPHPRRARITTAALTPHPFPLDTTQTTHRIFQFNLRLHWKM